MNSHDEQIRQMMEGLPRFSDGRVDYHDAKDAPVVNTVCECDGKILVLKRSENIGFYPSHWNGISGFIDEDTPLVEIVKKELKEELGLSVETENITICEPLVQEDKEIGKIWHVFPALVRFHMKPSLELDWEHHESKWIDPEHLSELTTVPGFVEVVNRAMSSGKDSG